jgi:hypothetical protein
MVGCGDVELSSVDSMTLARASLADVLLAILLIIGSVIVAVVWFVLASIVCSNGNLVLAVLALCAFGLALQLFLMAAIRVGWSAAGVFFVVPTAALVWVVYRS